MRGTELNDPVTAATQLVIVGAIVAITGVAAYPVLSRPGAAVGLLVADLTGNPLVTAVGAVGLVVVVLFADPEVWRRS